MVNELATLEILEREISIFYDEINHFNKGEREQIKKACQWSQSLHSDQLRVSGEPYFIHPLSVARILLGLQLDATAIVAGLLHDILEDTVAGEEELLENFGEDVTHLIKSLTKIKDIKVQDKTAQEGESIRKMLLAMDKDLRVILVKLADKTHNMRTLHHMRSDKQRRISQECLDIYAPLAGKLGIYSIKSELEDLSLKFLKPDIYKEIKSFLRERKQEREAYLQAVEEDITRKAKEVGITVAVHTRAKHFYSIYQKMKTKGKELKEIYDFLGIRILCENPGECYTLLGLIHQLYRPIAGRFKDYIAMPKENGYRSLHTTVITPVGKNLEIQIRSREMDSTAEFGVAAHWAYKEKKKIKLEDVNSRLLKKLRELDQEEHKDFLAGLKEDILKDTIFVFTPQGDMFELPQGATPIDFAYRIHGEVGEHCIGAKANNMIIPLNKPLQNTQTVTILTSPNAHPHVNWLRSVKTSRARSRIKAWLNKHNSSILIDRNTPATSGGTKKEAPKKKVVEPRPHQSDVRDKSKVTITLNQERNLMIRLSQCCGPNPGDPIVGFISPGRGIVVHHRNCTNLKGIDHLEERQVAVQWDTFSPNATQKFRVSADYVPDLFSAIEGAIRKHHGHLISGSIDETASGGLEALFTVELLFSGDFKKIIQSIKTIPAVQTIQRDYSQQ